MMNVLPQTEAPYPCLDHYAAGIAGHGIWTDCTSCHRPICPSCNEFYAGRCEECAEEQDSE